MQASDIGNQVLQASNGIEVVRDLSMGQLRTELANLQGTPLKGNPQPKDGVRTISRILGLGDHAEFNRTGHSLVLLKALIQGDCSSFPGLSADKFSKLQNNIFEYIGKEGEECPTGKAIADELIDTRKLGTLAIVLASHDIGKIEENIAKAKSVAKAAGRDITAGDDDAVILELADIAVENPEAVAGLFPAVAALPIEDRLEFRKAFSMSVNSGRIVQLEGAAPEFEGLVPRECAIAADPALYKAYHSLDMAGIWGFKTDMEAPTPPSFWMIVGDAMDLGFDVAGRVASGDLTPEQAYREIINERARKFGLDPDNPVEYAAIRLAGMRHSRGKMKAGLGDGYDIHPQDIVDFLQDSNEPTKAWRKELIGNLNRSGYDEKGPAITVGFAPDVGDRIAKAGITDPQVFLETWAQSIFAAQKALVAASRTTGVKATEKGLSADGKGQLVVELQPILNHIEQAPEALITGKLNLEFGNGRFNASSITPRGHGLQRVNQ